MPLPRLWSGPSRHILSAYASYSTSSRVAILTASAQMDTHTTHRRTNELGTSIGIASQAPLPIAIKMLKLLVVRCDAGLNGGFGRSSGIGPTYKKANELRPRVRIHTKTPQPPYQNVNLKEPCMMRGARVELTCPNNAFT